MPRKTRNKRGPTCGNKSEYVQIKSGDKCWSLFTECDPKPGGTGPYGSGPQSLNCAPKYGDIGNIKAKNGLCSTPDGATFKNTTIEIGDWCKYQWNE